MANSNLLKEAIADAKAVRETAIANAKIALEEAFTPRLQSILSQKLQQEMAEEDEDEDEVNEEHGAEDTSDADSSKIDGDNKKPQDKVNNSSDVAKTNPDTDVETAEVGMEPDEAEKAKVSEGEEEDEDSDEITEEDDITSNAEGEEISEEEEDELDLEAIIRELEEELDDEEEEEVEDIASDVVGGHEEEMHEEDEEEMDSDEEYMDSEDDMDDEIDLDEILREMGYGEEEEEVNEEEDDSELEDTKAELGEAIKTIKQLKSTINEVNLLNAKLLYTNKLFRSYDLTNEQKMKVVETLDRTANVREVKLVFSTLAESLKIGGTARKQKQTAKLTESFASKPVASTAPSKKVITESTNTMADRFKQLANIK